MMKRIITNVIAHILNILTPARLVVIAIVAFFFWFLAFGDQGAYQLRRLIEMKNSLLSQRQTLNDEIDRLTKDKEILSNPRNLEMVIRKELGYTRPGEIIFEENNNVDKR